MLCCFDEFCRSRNCRSTAVVTIIINAEEYWKIMLVAGKMSCVESHVIVAWLLLARCPALCYCTTLPHCNRRRRRRSYYAAPLAHCGLRYEKWTCMQPPLGKFLNCEDKCSVQLWSTQIKLQYLARKSVLLFASKWETFCGCCIWICVSHNSNCL